MDMFSVALDIRVFHIIVYAVIHVHVHFCIIKVCMLYMKQCSLLCPLDHLSLSHSLSLTLSLSLSFFLSLSFSLFLSLSLSPTIPPSTVDECGIVAQVSAPLAQAEISTYYISAYYTDYTLVSLDLIIPRISFIIINYCI